MKIQNIPVDDAIMADLQQDSFARVHWGQSAEDIVLMRILEGKKDGFYVDVGAHHPRRFSNTHMLSQFFGWRGLNIDASFEAISCFNEERPNDINVQELIGQGGDEITFTAFKGHARSTADPVRTEKMIRQGIEVLSQKTMRPRPLRDILSEHLPSGQEIDLLDVDVEGFDLQALQTNDWSKFGAKLVCVEDFEFKEGKGSNIRGYMESVGYVCVSHCFDTSIYKAV